ncbi:nucleolar transcription factor 1-like isoform X2 [Branchiostoma floridae x Branchiostoma japonicum]
MTPYGASPTRSIRVPRRLAPKTFRHGLADSGRSRQKLGQICRNCLISHLAYAFTSRRRRKRRVLSSFSAIFVLAAGPGVNQDGFGLGHEVWGRRAGLCIGDTVTHCSPGGTAWPRPAPTTRPLGNSTPLLPDSESHSSPARATRAGASSAASPNKGAKSKTASSMAAGVNGLKVKVKEEAQEGELWNLDTTKELLDRIGKVLPPDDMVKFKTREERMDWSDVAFGGFTGDQCKEKWQKISNEIRKFRTMSELIADAKEWLKNPFDNKKKPEKLYPDLPKKPLTPYFRYFLEKRKKYAEGHPEMDTVEVTKNLSQKFKQLPERKKAKYMQQYLKEREEYEANMVRFRQEHPDFAEEEMKKKGKTDEPTKPKTPVQMFIQEKVDDYMKAHPNGNKREATDALRKQWNALTDGKRIKWINKALGVQKKYTAEMEQYVKDHPDFERTTQRPLLTKAERKLKEKSEGRPDKPPPNGYSLFCQELMLKLTDVPNKERMQECSRRWKTMSQKEKDGYQKKAEELKTSFEFDFQRYLETLTPEDKERVLSEEKGGTKPKPAAEENGQSTTTRSSAAKSQTTSAAVVTPDRPKRPISAVFFYQQEKRQKLREKYPSLSNQEITRMLARKWSELSDKKKEKYKKMEEEARGEYEDQMQSFLKANPDYMRDGNSAMMKKKPPPSEARTAMELWREDKMESYVSRYRNDRKRATDALTAEWEKLPKREKQPWLQAAAEDKKRYERELADYEKQTKTGSSGAGNKTGKLFEGEPKRPPTSGYQLLSMELLGKLTDLDHRERMSEIGRRWKAMSDKERAAYNQRSQERMQQYHRDLHSWLDNLPADIRERYEQLHPSIGKKRKREANSPLFAKMIKKEKEEASEEESESEGSDEDDEEESGDEGSGNEGSGSGSGSGSESEGSESGSESGSSSEEEDNESGSGGEEDEEEGSGDEEEAEKSSSSSSESESSSSGSESESEEE